MTRAAGPAFSGTTPWAADGAALHWRAGKQTKPLPPASGDTMTLFAPDRRRFNGRLLAAGAAVALPAAQAQTWPSRPIRVIVPYTPGGFTDVTARLVAQKLQERLGQPVAIDNKPGANSIIGVDLIAKAPPDGHTIGVVIAAYAANTTLYAKLPYDPKKDLMPVSLIGVAPLIASVNNNAPFKTAAELVDYAKRNPGKVSFGSSGNGSAAHLTTGSRAARRRCEQRAHAARRQRRCARAAPVRPGAGGSRASVRARSPASASSCGRRRRLRPRSRRR